MVAVQKKIQTLTKSQQKRVLKFIDELIENEKTEDRNKFDGKIEKDINAGKLDGLAAKALEDFKNNRFKAL